MSDFEALLRRVVIAWDSDDDLDFDEAMTEARAATGLVLADDSEDVLDTLKRQHGDDFDEDQRQERRNRRLNRS